MLIVAYAERYPYRYETVDRAYPIFTVMLRNPLDATQAVEADGFLDSGAEISVFGGWVAQAIGLDPTAGRPWRLESALGAAISARRMEVHVQIPGVGRYPLIPAFVLDEMKRNLLGRDIFNMMQLGFQERHQEFLLGPNP